MLRTLGLVIIFGGVVTHVAQPVKMNNQPSDLSNLFDASNENAVVRIVILTTETLDGEPVEFDASTVVAESVRLVGSQLAEHDPKFSQLYLGVDQADVWV